MRVVNYNNSFSQADVEPEATAATLSRKRYTLLKTKAKLTAEHKKAIAQSFRHMQIPFQYLRKNSKDYREAKHTKFNNPALTFIAVVNAFSETRDEAPYSLADLVDIIKNAWECCQESRDQIIACLAYTLPTEQYIAVFLELAPAEEKFDASVGWSRSTGLYDSFFPQLTEAVSANYLKVFCEYVSNMISAYVDHKALNEERIQKIDQELKPKLRTVTDESSQESKVFKELKKIDELSLESQNFTQELIDPIIEFLSKTIQAIPPELKLFLHESRCYLTDFKEKPVNVLQQLCGLFYLKFIHPAILLSEQTKILEGVSKRALTIIAANIQSLSTLSNDKRLFDLIEQISVKTPLNTLYLPDGISNGSEPSMPLSSKLDSQSDILHEALRLLTPPAPQKLREFEESEGSQSQLTARGAAEYATSSDDGGSEALNLKRTPSERSPLVRKKPKPTLKEFNRYDAGKYTLAFLLLVLGAFFSNSIILEDIGAPPNNLWSRNLGPVWSSVIGTIPGLIFLTAIIILHCRRDNSENRRTNFRENPSRAEASTFHRKVADGTTTEDDPAATSFASADEADAEEGETPRAGQ